MTTNHNRVVMKEREWCCKRSCRKHDKCAKFLSAYGKIGPEDIMWSSLEVGGVDCFVAKDGKAEEESL